MFCVNCGSEINPEARFCTSCGKETQPKPIMDPIRPVEQDFVNQGFENLQNQKNEKSGKTSKVIGIISIILVFIFQTYVIPLAIVGLIFGLKYKKQTNQNKFGIGFILNAIAILIAIPLFIIYSNLLLSNVNPISGTWNCYSTFANDKNYTLQLSFDKNEEFLIKSLPETLNSTIKGKYEFELRERQGLEDVTFYSIEMTAEEWIAKGEKKDQEAISELNLESEMAVSASGSKNDGQAMFIFAANNQLIYNCDRQK